MRGWTDIRREDADKIKAMTWELISQSSAPILDPYREFYPSDTVNPAALMPLLWWIKSASFKILPGGPAAAVVDLSRFREAIPKPFPEASRAAAAIARAENGWRDLVQCDHQSIVLALSPEHVAPLRGLAARILGREWASYSLSFESSESPESIAADWRRPQDDKPTPRTAQINGQTHYIGIAHRAFSGRVAGAEEVSE
jgi:hypothetical protein